MLLLALMLIGDAPIPPDSPTPPVTRCEIDLGTWCMIHFDGVVTMRQDREGTRWTLRDRIDKDPVGITIVENANCRVARSEGPWSIRILDNVDGANSRSYRLTSGYCSIEVSFSTRSELAVSYEQFAKYGIMLSDAQKGSVGDRLDGRI